MKLSAEEVQFLETVITTGKSINIDNIIIEDGTIRAIDDDRTVVIYQQNTLEMPFGSIGLNRIGVLLSRLKVVKEKDDFSLDAIASEDEYVRSIILRCNGTKVDYRCANPDTIHAPKQINDDLIYRIQLNQEAVSLMQEGAGAMGSDIIAFSGGDGVQFSLTDISSDVFTHEFAADFDRLDDAAPATFNHSYPIKTILALFKQNPNGYFEIGGKGILKININGLDTFVLPQV